jgi:hypothetical protein
MADRDTVVEETIPVGMFTETLARLYMRQGHVDQALRIYRHLAVQQPGDVGLKHQILALEHQLATAPEMDAEAAPAWRPALPAGSEAALPGVQALRSVNQTQEVIARLESWLRVLRRRRASADRA